MQVKHCDPLVPTIHVRHGRPFIAWLVSVAACIVAGAVVAGAAWFVNAERVRLEAYFTTQDAAAHKITVVYEQNGILCSVPREQERAAAVVFQGCSALGGALKAAGMIK